MLCTKNQIHTLRTRFQEADTGLWMQLQDCARAHTRFFRGGREHHLLAWLLNLSCKLPQAPFNCQSLCEQDLQGCANTIGSGLLSGCQNWGCGGGLGLAKFGILWEFWTRAAWAEYLTEQQIVVWTRRCLARVKEGLFSFLVFWLCCWDASILQLLQEREGCTEAAKNSGKGETDVSEGDLCVASHASLSMDTCFSMGAELTVQGNLLPTFVVNAHVYNALCWTQTQFLRKLLRAITLLHMQIVQQLFYKVTGDYCVFVVVFEEAQEAFASDAYCYMFLSQQCSSSHSCAAVQDMLLLALWRGDPSDHCAQQDLQERRTRRCRGFRWLFQAPWELITYFSPLCFVLILSGIS